MNQGTFPPQSQYWGQSIRDRIQSTFLCKTPSSN